MKKRTSCSLFFAFLLLSGVFAGSAFIATAQQPASQGAATPSSATVSTPSASASPAPAASPQASSAVSPTPSLPKVVRIEEGHLELDELIGVEVEGLSEWAAKNDTSKLVPYINGRAIIGNYPEAILPTKNHLQFHLQLTPENKDVWIDLLGEPNALHRPVAFSVGPEGVGPFDSKIDKSNRVPLTIISPVYGLVALFVILGTLFILIWLARSTNLIRERGAVKVPGKLKPYNLGRSQMAFWFFLVYASYTAIWLVTDALDTITPSLLGLMGISAGTALGEALIDSGKDESNDAQLQAVVAEKQALEQSIPDLQAQLNAVSAKATPTLEDTTSRDSLNKQLQDSRTRLSQITQQIEALTPPESRAVSSGFLRDILADSTGYSFHRFQIFAWTIILGIIFVSAVYNSLNMPEFSPTLLGLMGLSSGTYIGFKFPEKK
ncbi:MAG: coiled-coil domain-containing protein [Pyrinomonadaceae bacterium]